MSGAEKPAWPARIADEAALEELMTTPDAALRDSLARLDGDIVVLGVGGKMGPTLAGLAKRAAPEQARRRRRPLLRPRGAPEARRLGRRRHRVRPA